MASLTFLTFCAMLSPHLSAVSGARVGFKEISRHQNEVLRAQYAVQDQTGLVVDGSYGNLHNDSALSPEAPIIPEKMPVGFRTIVVSVGLSIIPATLAIILGITQLLPYKCPYKLGSTSPHYSLWQRCFLAERSYMFAGNAEMALRGAVFGVVAAAPFFVPDMFFLVQEGRYTSFAVVMYVFTLYKTVGDTLNFAYVGLIGTFLAVLNVWVMNGFFPGGVTGPNSPMFLPGVVDTIGFAILILALNIDNATRIFALSWHTYFMMSFLSPTTSGGWSVGFTIDIRGPAVSALLQSGIGCGLAIFATLLPFPIFALDKARTTAAKLTVTLSETFATTVECYCANSKQPIIEDQARRDIKLLQADVLELEGHLASSWWECLGLGRSEAVRNLLGKLDHATRELYDRILAIQYSLKMEDFGPKHVKAMEKMKPVLETLVSEAGKLFFLEVDAIMDASISEAELAALEAQKVTTIAAIEAVSRTFEEGHDGLDIETIDENAFCLSCCAFGRTTVEFVDTLKETDYNKKATFDLPDVIGCFRVPIFDKVYRNQVLRNSFSYLIAFYVGYTGYSLMILDFNSGPATTVALLISTGLGSSVVKNLNRLQGVVLGTFFGMMAYAFLAWCDTAGFIKVAVFVFLWLLVTLYTYFNGSDFATVACLLAAFGAQGVLRGCSDEPFAPGDVTHTITNTVLGVTFMTLVDLIFVLKSPSHFAKDALCDAWDTYKAATDNLFSKDDPSVRKHGGSLFGVISTASSASALADAEPRIWKTPFKYNLFQDVIRACLELRCSLCCMENASSASDQDGNPKASFIKAMYMLPAFQVVKADFDHYTESVEKIFDIFVHETDADFLKSTGLKLVEHKDHKIVVEENMKKLLTALDPFAVQQKKMKQDDIEKMGSAFHNLENNVACKISMVLFTMTWQFNVLYDMKHQMLSD